MKAPDYPSITHRKWEIRNPQSALGLLALLALFASRAFGEDLYWDWNSGSGDWSNAAKWYPPQVPTASDDATIGANGTAWITSGPKACGWLSLGYYGGEAGTLEMSGGSLAISNDLRVGRYGPGQLTFESGGRVSNSFGYLGYESGVTGKVLVDGRTAIWTNRDSLYVGYKGAGELTLQKGGKVESDIGYLGDQSGSTGKVVVSGGASLWTNSGFLRVGSRDAGRGIPAL
jgi:T5SS/PEP-CTERM-associated repeat protein